MKIQLKTLKQTQFQMDVDPLITIQKLKEMIESEHSHPVSHQVLIFSGKVLSNENTIESYKIKENDFLVLMIKKPAETAKIAPISTEKVTLNTPTTAPLPESSQTQPKPQSQTQAQAQPQPRPQPQPQAQPTQQTQAQQVPDLYNQSASTFVSGPELQNAADAIVAMGFPRDRVLLALQAGFGNPDRALDYLFNGIPQNLVPPSNPRPSQGQPALSAQTSATPQTPARPQPSGTPQNHASSEPSGGLSNIWTGGVQLPVNLLPPSLLAQTQGAAPPRRPAGTPAGGARGSGGGGGSGGLFEFLRNHPAFPQIMQIAQNEPERLQEVMTRMIQQNPQLLTLIQQNSDEFRDMMSEGMGEGGGGGIQIRVTPQDEEAVGRLTGLGFSRNKALEAYFLFEKDEQMAANYLLSYGMDEEEMEFVDEEDHADGDDDDDE